jgi:hypothetical protein
MTAIPKPTRAGRVKVHRVDYGALALSKPVYAASPKFRAWVRSLGCQVRKHSAVHLRCSPTEGTNYSPRAVIVFSHVPTGGHRAMSRKASDIGNGIGMCADLELEFHAIGQKSFQVKYGVDMRAIAAKLGEEWTRKERKR